MANNQSQATKRETTAEAARILKALRLYREAKKELDRDVLTNEDWFRAQHWKHIKGRQPGIGHEPTTPFILNGVWNKHADAMDNYPEPLFFEREESDRAEAEKLSKIIPLVLEKNDFERVYSDVCWQKIKQGTGIYYVGWDSSKEGGLGDIIIKKVDILHFYVQPHVDDIQKSPFIFVLSLADVLELKRRYPGKMFDPITPGVSLSSYFGSYSQEELAGKCCLIDCYEKCRNKKGKEVVHLTKIAGNTILYSTKTDKNLKETGLYAHGLYPFVLDPYIPNEGSPFGIGLIEIARPTQAYIDRLDYLIERNCLVSGRQRWLVKRSSGIRPEDVRDLSKDFIECDSSVDDSVVRPLQAATFPSHILEHRQNKIGELKEVIGNRDFTQGGTSSNVTAYKAITALQETGNKLSRDTQKSSYRAFRDIVNLCMELIREFYDEERSFRIAGPDGRVEYASISNANLKEKAETTLAGETVYRKAIFDIKIVPQQKTAFTSSRHNELIEKLYEEGAFTPQKAEGAIVALNAMMLDNKDSIIKALQEIIQKNA